MFLTCHPYSPLASPPASNVRVALLAQNTDNILSSNTSGRADREALRKWMSPPTHHRKTASSGHPYAGSARLCRNGYSLRTWRPIDVGVLRSRKSIFLRDDTEKGPGLSCGVRIARSAPPLHSSESRSAGEYDTTKGARSSLVSLNLLRGRDVLRCIHIEYCTHLRVSSCSLEPSFTKLRSGASLGMTNARSAGA